MPPRLSRWHTFGHDHFITFSCHNRNPYLNNDHARLTFLHTLEKLRRRHRFFVFGYVLMPEHAHLLLSEPPKLPLSNLVGALKTQTSKQLKGDLPHFWLPRYYDFNVYTERKFTEKLRYIHRNPVNRGLVAKPEHFRWSSFNQWLTGHPAELEVESNWTRDRRDRASHRVPHS